MEKKLIINFQEYLDTVEKLAIEVNKKFKPTVLVGIMRGAAPIIDILSRIFKLPTAYIVIQSYSGKGLEDKQGDLIFARDISSIAQQKDFERVLLVDDLSDTGLTLNRSIDWLKNYQPVKSYIKDDELDGGKKKTRRKGGKWSMKYKKAINCKKPKGFSQKQYCKYGRKKN